jgi:threonine aldolase
VDSVMFCLSKGLRSPVGSVLCGTSDFIEEARYWRKRLGGGMRQAGILAACGIISLTKMVDRLVEDHQRAKQIAKAINKLPGFKVDMSSVQTNMVMVDLDRPATEVQERLHAKKVWALPVGPQRLRLVLHADVDDDKLNRAIEAFCVIAEMQAAG